MVSNRVPSAAALDPNGGGAVAVGGLVSAVRASLAETGGVWLGWSGRASRGRAQEGGRPNVARTPGPVELATIDLTSDESNLFYTGFANRTLWPILHGLIERAQIRRDTYRAYRRVNRRYARALSDILAPDDVVWVHDYHLFPVARELRRGGWDGKIGFFLHTPFPAADAFSVLPWSTEILESMLAYDLIGVHTRRYLVNLVDALGAELGGDWNGRDFARRGESARLGVFPIGIDPRPFQDAARTSSETLAGALGLSPDERVIIGVDRLDYTKGIPHRLEAFQTLLDRHRDLRGRVTLVQIANPSRARVPEYVSEREKVERLTGRVNGAYSEGGWLPVRYLYRYFSQETLAAFYRDASVNMVTPLRDGMNLIAKEYVASQTDDPGALILSEFAGAAAELTDALIVNPFDVDGAASALYDALAMPENERRERWERMNRLIQSRTAAWWSGEFTAALLAAPSQSRLEMYAERGLQRQD